MKKLMVISFVLMAVGAFATTPVHVEKSPSGAFSMAAVRTNLNNVIDLALTNELDIAANTADIAELPTTAEVLALIDAADFKTDADGASLTNVYDVVLQNDYSLNTIGFNALTTNPADIATNAAHIAAVSNLASTALQNDVSQTIKSEDDGGYGFLSVDTEGASIGWNDGSSPYTYWGFQTDYASFRSAGADVMVLGDAGDGNRIYCALPLVAEGVTTDALTVTGKTIIYNDTSQTIKSEDDGGYGFLSVLTEGASMGWNDGTLERTRFQTDPDYASIYSYAGVVATFGDSGSGDIVQFYKPLTATSVSASGNIAASGNVSASGSLGVGDFTWTQVGTNLVLSYTAP